MMTIDAASLGALALQLAKCDAAQQAMSDAIDTLEAAAIASHRMPDKEPARLACAQALHQVSEEYDEALLELAEIVRVALYGAEVEDDDE